MLPRLVDAYHDAGFVFELGSPAMLWCGVTPRAEWTPRPRFGPLNHRQIAVGLRDAWFFRLIADAFDAAGLRTEDGAAFVIGNSYGVSTLMIAELFRPMSVDAIDAETSCGSGEGSELTRRLAAQLELDVRVTAGFSPQEIDRACRSPRYQLAFIDGEHTDEQIVIDFDGVADRLDDPCVVVLHDVGLRDMDAGWLAVRERAAGLGFRGFDLSATDSGSTVLVRGLPDLERYLERTCPGLRAFNDTYHAGLSVPTPPQRPETDLLVVRDDQTVAFFGAGRDLAAYGHFMLAHPDRVEAIYDDDASKTGRRRYGVPIRAAEDLASSAADMIVISTHGYLDAARRRIAELRPDLDAWPRVGLIPPTRVVATPGAPTPVLV